LLGLYAGLRIGEVVGLRWRNVDLERGWISVTEQRQAVRKKGVVVSDPKSASGVRRIPLAAPLKTWLEGRPKGEYVVTNRKGKAATGDMVSVAFKALVTKAGLTENTDEHGVALADPTMHDLRHTFCYYMANGWHKPDGTRTPSVPITTLCKIAGHATIQITADYYVETDDRDMVAAMANVTPPEDARRKRSSQPE
jgi:integrase